MKLPSTSLCLIALLGVFMPCAFAADPPSAAPLDGPRSITEQVLQERARIEEYQQLIKSANASTRQAALQHALRDPDPVIRSNAMTAYLKRFNALLPEVVLPQSTTVSIEEVPRLALHQLKWSDDGSSAAGFYSSPCNGYTVVRLQVAGGKLSITYDGVCLRPRLLNIDTGGDSVKAAKETLTPCQLTMEPNAAQTSLDGPLHCVGMTTDLPVSLPFGP